MACNSFSTAPKERIPDHKFIQSSVVLKVVLSLLALSILGAVSLHNVFVIYRSFHCLSCFCRILPDVGIGCFVFSSGIERKGKQRLDWMIATFSNSWWNAVYSDQCLQLS
ncbi:Uncharacterized protein Fot_43253 [Forsythia ovata]|uniref:Uncharacterized protein n=1 Tax=Forsythia ovata TaxID=205694 RepID=A0ABD1RP70_9LAMI